jgi:hypothetical protein
VILYGYGIGVSFPRLSFLEAAAAFPKSFSTTPLRGGQPSSESPFLYTPWLSMLMSALHLGAVLIQ